MKLPDGTQSRWVNAILTAADHNFTRLLAWFYWVQIYLKVWIEKQPDEKMMQVQTLEVY